MSRPETLVSLLRLVRASGGAIETRIRIQKEAYLLAVAGLADFRTADFYYHHYGPYSRSISDTLQFAVSSGLIEEVRETAEDESFTRYTYILTGKAERLLAQVDRDDQDYVDAVNFLEQSNWRALELAATVKFLELNDKTLSRGQSFNQAISLKPATAGFANEAASVLAYFGE
jgi:uncharacterized protein YwgA